MRRIIVGAILFIGVVASASGETVYYLEDSKKKRYHATSLCRSLSRTPKFKIKESSLEKAKKKGKTECRMRGGCYR